MQAFYSCPDALAEGINKEGAGERSGSRSAGRIIWRTLGRGDISNMNALSGMWVSLSRSSWGCALMAGLLVYEGVAVGQENGQHALTCAKLDRG